MSLPLVLDTYFKLTERGSTLFTEIRAGTATFLTLCYILAGLAQPATCFLLVQPSHMGSALRPENHPPHTPHILVPLHDVLLLL